MEASALVIWLHGLQSCACHIQQLLIATRIRYHFPWVKWLLPESEIGELTMLPQKRLKRWFDLHRQPIIDGEEHAGMQEAIDRIHSLLQAAVDRGFPPERIVLCGFSQGGALALQAGLSFPHTLAGICSVAGWLSSGMPAAERWEMPILMCHGFDDSMVPIEVARSSCKALAALGYKKVNLITFNGLRHQLSTLQFEDIMDFYRQLLPQRLEEPCPVVSIPRPTGCIVWMHDASIAGDVDEHILVGRLHQCLPDVQLILQRVPPCREGKSFGRTLLDEITEQLRKASAGGWPLSSVILGGFGAGGTAALLGLLFPQLAGLVSCSGFLADCFPEQQAESGSDQLILLTHGVEDKIVPIASARQQREALGSYGYRGVSFSAFQDLGHHFSVEVWDNVIEFAEIALDRALDE